MKSDLPTILIVDDDRINIKVLDKMLKREGYQTLSAGNGNDAFETAKAQKPDLILLDIMMPEIDGFETCRNLQQKSTTTDIPIIFLSALNDIKSKVKAFETGGVDYIAKPFEKAEVLARVRLHLKLSMASRAMIALQSEKFKQLHDAQQVMLVDPKDLPEANFGISYNPLLEAGGDFYEVLSVGEGIFGYFVADVSGHDLGASFITPAVKALLSQYASPMYTPADVLKNINNILCTMMTDGNHLTASYVRLNRSRRQLEIVNAGHTPVLHVSVDGQTDVLETSGDVLGAFGNVHFDSVIKTVSDGDRFFMYSDGLIEGFGENKKSRPEGLDLLSRACQASMGLPIQDAVTRIYSELLPGEAVLEDDVVLLGVEV